MQDIEKCGCQWFPGSEIPFDRLFEIIALAHLYMEHIGPMIMICSEEGYDFLARNGLEDFYIDVIMVTEEEVTLQLVNKMIDNNAVVENSLKECSENLRNLYTEFEGTLGELKEKIESVISNERVIKSI